MTNKPTQTKNRTTKCKSDRCSLFRGCALSAFFAMFVAGCMLPPPANYTWTQGEGGWTSVLVSEKISYELAFDDITSVIMRQFELDMISKDTGYIRTKWKSDFWGGQETYRTRIVAKISKERKRVEFNVEVHKRDHLGNWIVGHDTQKTSTIKSDIAGIVGM